MLVKRNSSPPGGPSSHLKRIEVDTPRKVSFGFLKFDSHDPALSVKIEHHAGRHFLAFYDLGLGESEIKDIGLVVVAAVYRLRPRSRNTVSTRAMSPATGIYTTRSTRPSRSGRDLKARTASGHCGSGSVASGSFTVRATHSISSLRSDSAACAWNVSSMRRGTLAHGAKTGPSRRARPGCGAGSSLR